MSDHANDKVTRQSSTDMPSSSIASSGTKDEDSLGEPKQSIRSNVTTTPSSRGHDAVQGLTHVEEPAQHPKVISQSGSDTTYSTDRNILKMSTKRFMSLVAMGLLWTGSQIPVYLFGKSFPDSVTAPMLSRY